MADIKNKNELKRRIELFMDELDYSINEEFCKETMMMMREFIGRASHLLDCADAKIKKAKRTARNKAIDEFAEKFIFKAVCEGCSGCCNCHEEGKQSECEDWKSYMKIAEEYNNDAVKGDLISRRELIEKVQMYFSENRIHQNDLAEVIVNLPTYKGGWIPCSERLPECKNKYGWVSCIVSVIRSHYPTSTYDICDSPYDENIVMHANYHVSQKIWHLESDEQLNAMIDIEDAPLNGDYVIAWQPLPEPYQPENLQKS